MSGITIRFCTLCEGADARMAVTLRSALAANAISATVDTADCMSGCARGPSLSVRAPGKTAYLFGEFGRGDIADLIVFLRLYEASAQGDLEDARAIGGLRFKAIARIPGPASGSAS